MKPAAIAASVTLLLSCGYGFSERYVARGGAARVQVRTFANQSAEPELGAILTGALRTELSRRGADAGADAGAAIEGEVRAGQPALTSPPRLTPSGVAAAATWRIGIEVRARLVSGGAAIAEHTVRRETDYLGGIDPLETEARRALALRRLADEAAREVLRAFER